ncbi:uncharacterized protein LOC100164443 isoform X3 [Acyrthosiphon pisum]|uniref:Uncharacterized protein n=1 Tax=Acyrthosiphon pisum TaxID=7029 RepID=A0A8R2NPY9_ACYPI|nr:uncharacterized protein LOC100164443 isoform X3 [Acyrthosiphon pisum]
MVDRRMAYEAYRKRTEIPRGLDYLAERLVRAVIRVQPKNVHEFAAQFFDGLLRQRDHSSKSRSSSPERGFEPPNFETVPVTRQPKKSYNTSATGISDDRVYSDVEYDEDSDEDMAMKCDDFEKYALDIEDDLRSVHYVEATALTTLAATSSSVAIIGTTAKCKSAGASPATAKSNPADTSPPIRRQQSSSPSSSASPLPPGPRPPLIGSVSQPLLDDGKQTSVRKLDSEIKTIAVVSSAPEKETEEMWLSEEQWTEHLATKSGHRVIRSLAEDAGPPPPSPSPFSASAHQWPLQWPVAGCSKQTNLDRIPVGVIEVLDCEPVDQRRPPPTKAQRFPKAQRASRGDQNIPLPVIHAMGLKSDSLNHEDMFKTMRVQPSSSDKHGFRSRTGTGSSTFDSSSRKPFLRQSNETKPRYTEDEFSAATGWMINMPVFAKCPPAKSKSLPSREVPSKNRDSEVEMTEKQHCVHRGSSLPYDNNGAETSTEIIKRNIDDKVKIPTTHGCDTIIPHAIDKPDSLKNSNNHSENHKLDVEAATEKINPIDVPNEVQPVHKAEKELVNTQAVDKKNVNDVEEAPVKKQELEDSKTDNSSDLKKQEPESETEFRLTMIHSVREAVNRICEQAVEKTAAIVRGLNKRNSTSTLTSSLQDRDQSEHTDNTMLQLPTETSWPPPPKIYESDEHTLAPEYSFDLPDPPTDIYQVDTETEKLDITDEEMKATGLPSDDDTETGDGVVENDHPDNEIDAVMKSTANGGSSDGSVEAAIIVAQDNGADDRAATTIQAVYRGFRARKYVEAVNAAAVKIQAGFRGYRVRQSLKNAAPSTATTTTDESQCWSDDDQKSVVSVTYAPLKEYGCEPRGAGDGRGDNGSDDGGDGPSPVVGIGDSVSGVPGNVGDGGGDRGGDHGGDGDGRSGVGNIGGAHVDAGPGVIGVGVYEDDDDDDDELQTGDDEVFERDDKDISGGDNVGNLVTKPTTTLSEPATPTEVSTPDNAAEADELVQAAIKIQARVRGFAARKRFNEEKNDGSDKK